MIVHDVLSLSHAFERKGQRGKFELINSTTVIDIFAREFLRFDWSW